MLLTNTQERRLLQGSTLYYSDTHSDDNNKDSQPLPQPLRTGVPILMMFLMTYFFTFQSGEERWQHAFLWSQSQRNLLIPKPIIRGRISSIKRTQHFFTKKNSAALPKKYTHRKGTRLKKGSRSSSIVLTTQHGYHLCHRCNQKNRYNTPKKKHSIPLIIRNDFFILSGLVD